MADEWRKRDQQPHVAAAAAALRVWLDQPLPEPEPRVRHGYDRAAVAIFGVSVAAMSLVGAMSMEESRAVYALIGALLGLVGAAIAVAGGWRTHALSSKEQERTADAMADEDALDAIDVLLQYAQDAGYDKTYLLERYAELIDRAIDRFVQLDMYVVAEHLAARRATIPGFPPHRSYVPPRPQGGQSRPSFLT